MVTHGELTSYEQLGASWYEAVPGCACKPRRPSHSVIRHEYERDGPFKTVKKELIGDKSLWRACHGLGGLIDHG